MNTKLGVRYAQNHSWIFSSLSNPILNFFLKFYIKHFIKLRQTVRFDGILFITKLVIFVLGRSQIWYSKKKRVLSVNKATLKKKRLL